MANTRRWKGCATTKQRCCLGFGALLVCVQCAAATWLDSISITFDTPVQSAAGVVSPQQILKTQYGAAPQPVSIGLPSNVSFSAMTFNGANVLFVPNVPFALNASTVTPRDVIQYASGTASVYLSAGTLGLPSTVKIDAIARSGSDLLFSVNAPASISGVKVWAADILRWNGSAVSILYSAQQLSLPAGANITGLEHLPNGHLLLSFGAGGKVASVTYRAGEILEYAPSDSSWALVRSQAQFDATCNPCRTRGIAAVADLDVIFRNGNDLYEH